MKIILMKKLLPLFLMIFSFYLPAQDLQTAAPMTDVFNGGRGASFNDGWKFNFGNVSTAYTITYNDASWRNQVIPHDWGIEYPFNKNSAAGSDGAFLDGGIGWYRKTFTLPSHYTGKRITIQFEGIYMNSTVWINGQNLGTRPYGYATFEYDLTPFLNFGGANNIIAVKVDNSQQKNSRWYSGSGIYRNIWITATNPVHIAYCGSFVRTPIVNSSQATTSISTVIQNHSIGSRTVASVSIIYDKTGTVVATATNPSVAITAGGETTVTSTLSVSSPIFWSTTNPYLYTVITEIFDGTTKIDNYSSTLGFRTLSYNATTGFALNGASMKIKGVCMHHDLGCLGSAQNYRALERQVQLVKSFGCNAIRTSHNPPAPELLEICDRMGMLVMDEAFDCWTVGKTTFDYHLNFNTWAKTDIQELVKRDRNHPCVIMWSIGNEIPDYGSATGISAATSLISWITEVDNTHKIACGQDIKPMPTGVANLLDIVGYNYASGTQYDTDHANHPNWIMMGSETSSAVRSRSVYHLPTNVNATNADMQCSSYDNNWPGWATSAENAWRIDRDRNYIQGQFIWTGFDYLGEPTPYANTFPSKSSYFGIIDLAGFPKDIYYFYQSQWTSKPMVHLLPHWNWQQGAIIPVWTYTNCDSVRLVLNDLSLGVKKIITGGPMHLEWLVPFEGGKVKAYAFRKGIIVAMDSIETAGLPTKLGLKVDRDTILANGRDLAFVETNILDANGVFCPDADNMVNYSIIGPGKIVGVDNGNSISLESFKASSRTSFKGKCLAVVQSTGAPGQIVLTASTPTTAKNIALAKTTSADSENTIQLRNVALAKTVTTDSQESANPATNAVDGNGTTRWCANNGATGHWLKVDLGSNTNLIGGEIVWEKSGVNYLYKIETSTDDNTWTTVINKTANNTNTTQTQAVSFTATARYVRITVSGISTGWASLYEFNLYNGEPTYANITVGKVITTDSQESANYAANAIDGNTATRWCASDGNGGHWLKIDLLSNLNLVGAEVMWEKAGNAYLYKIETSTDNTNWTLAVDKTTSTSASQTQLLDFSATARYVRITITGGVGLNWASIYEIRLFDGTPSLMPNANLAGKGNDNDITTSWQAADGNANHWWMIDLGSDVPVTGSEINWLNAGVAYQYKIDASSDSIAWITVADKTTNSNTAQRQTDDFITTTRYLKVTVIGGVNSVNKANMTEFKAFDGTTTTFTPASVIINSVSTSGASNLQEPSSKIGFQIYPNPASSTLYIELTKALSHNKSLTVYDIIGKKVMSHTFEDTQNKLQIDVSGLGNGIYFFNINGGTKKVVIAKN